MGMTRKYWKGIDELKELLTFDKEAISQFEEEGSLIYKDETIEITLTGQFFMRNIAASFDPKMKTNEKTFSKAL